jgi:hypothetical protein
MVIIEARACYAVSVDVASRASPKAAARAGFWGHVPKWATVAALGPLMRYAPNMPSSPNAPPRTSLFTGRARWFWIAVAALLGAWLIALLAISDRVISDGEPSPEPATRRASDPAHVEGKTEKAFNRRREVRASRPLPAVPLRMDHGEGK